MKILAVSHEYPPIGGGGANAAYYLLNGFLDRGHEVTLVTTAWESRNEKDNDPSGNSDNADSDRRTIDIHEVRSRRNRADSCSFSEMLDYLFKARKKADELVKKAISDGNAYDLVLVFFGIPSGPIGYLLKKRYDLPYIIRFGGGDIPGFQQRFKKLYKVLGPGIKRIWRSADARIANSEGLRRMAYDFCKEYPFEVISNGVDTQRYRPAADRNDREYINILFVSRLIERKGLQHIIPMISDISEKTSKGIKLTVVGDGPYRNELERLIEENSVAEFVDFAGEKHGDELIAAYQDADLFILPSSNEGMPNVVLEAMACGLPVIMTPCQGSAELINGNGFIAEISDFAGRITELISDDRVRREMAEASRKNAEENFSWNSTIESYMCIANRILEYRKEP